MIGPSAPGASAVELPPDVKRLCRPGVAAAAQVPTVRVYVDGQGSGYGDTPVRGSIYDAAGAFVASSAEHIVPDGAAPGWINLAVPGAAGVGPGAIGSLQAGAPTGAYQQVARETPNALRFFPFDGSVADAFGNPINSSSSLTYGPPLADVTGQSAYFTGAAVDPVIFSGADLSSATLSFHTIISFDDFAATRGIIRFGWTGSTSGGTFSVRTDGRLQIDLQRPSGNAIVAAPASSALVAGQVYKIGFKLDGTNLTIYVNGVPVFTQALTYIPTTGVSWILGRSSGAHPTGYLKGWMDSVLIVGRALSDGEFADLAAGTYRKGRSARVWGDDFATPVVNELVNPSWEVDATANGGTRVTTDSFVGAACGERVAAAVSAGLLSFSSASTQYVVPVTPGETVYVQAAAKLVATTFVGAGTDLRLKVQRYDRGKGAITATSVNGQATKVDPAVGQWHVLYGNFTVPADTFYVSLSVYYQTNAGAADSTLRADAGMLVHGARSGPLPYGDGSTPGWTWDGAPHASTSRGPQGIVNYHTQPTPDAGSTSLYGVWNSTTKAISAAEFREGASSVAFTCPGTVVGEGMQGISVSVPGGGTHTCGAWVKAPAGALMEIHAVERDATDTFIGSSFSTFVGTGDWQWVTATRTFSATSVKARPWVRTRTSAQAIVFYVNAVTFTNASSLTAPIMGTMAGCNWLGTANASPSIRWQVPEVFDTYSDGAAATTGLTPAGAKLPSTLSLAFGELFSAAASSLSATSDFVGYGVAQFNESPLELSATATLTGEGVLSMAAVPVTAHASAEFAGSGVASYAAGGQFAGSSDFAGTGVLQIRAPSVEFTAAGSWSGFGGMSFIAPAVGLAGRATFEHLFGPAIEGRIATAGTGQID